MVTIAHDSDNYSRFLLVDSDGRLHTLEGPPDEIFNGQKDVAAAGTAVALSTSQAIKRVTIKAKSTNGNLIFVGDSSVSSSNGYILAANEEISILIDNLNKVYIDSAANDDGVSYIAY